MGAEESEAGYSFEDIPQNLESVGDSLRPWEGVGGDDAARLRVQLRH